MAGAEAVGRARITPHWRALKAKGELNPGVPGGVAMVRLCLEAECHTIEVRGQRISVVDIDRRLQPLDG